jgi:hypothetical protein
MMTLDANLVLTSVLSFQGSIPHSNLSCLLFQCFFIHVIIFYKVACASFMFIYIKPFEVLLPLIVYWQALNITCLKHVPS